MKILVLAPKPPWPPLDGGAVATMRCIEGMAAGGAEISLLSMQTEKHLTDTAATSPPASLLRHHETVSVDTSIRPVKLLGNLIFSTEPYDLVRFRSRAFSSALRTLLLREQFDIIQCEGILFIYYVTEIRELSRAPVILRAHNVEHRIREMMADRTSDPLRIAYLKNLSARIRKKELSAARIFDAIVPISEPDFQWFRSFATGKPVMLSETGAEVADSFSEQMPGEMKVGFIGALNWEPNLDGLKWFLKKVWPHVLKSHPDAKLFIAGRGASDEIAGQLDGINVIFLGEIDDARSFMESMTVLIAPLFAGSGLRIKIIEAMSLGKTVVTTPVAATGLPVTNGQELFIAKDAVSFSRALTATLMNPAIRKTTGEAAMDMVRKRYNNLSQTRRMLEFYETVCHGC
ncbi:MAG: glycosyltransferase family 4 protein [Bacteroidales bacterium]|jgi:glycosyltransferase involved in cell wall biosynthesis|nr:glycosyltransferase family 4 protein [Bacteroidales bacterium]